MKSIGFAVIAASGLAAGILGFAAPAQAAVGVDQVSASFATDYRAGVDHHVWLDQIQPKAVVPQVDNTVHQSH